MPILGKKKDTQPAPDIKFIRTDTFTQEELAPSAVADEDDALSPRRAAFFRRSSRSSDKSERGLSNLLHIHSPRSRSRSRSRSGSTASVNVPADLPQIPNECADDEEREARWEQRATTLIQSNPRISPSPSRGRAPSRSQQTPGYLEEPRRGRSRSNSRVNDPEGDVTIQEAIRLHEAGELERSTEMFHKLADPNGADNALAQVLYGLALRHGWGCEPDPAKAVKYLSAAAANSAEVESQALKAGMKKGGAAKGELVLAIFELANCFRYGWGIEKDPVAARQYYETAANLGDPDAMNECAWCYLEGFGGKKDKYTAAKYYRMAEQHGNKILGNSWIWKEKYNPK
ncbi:hypothetical protein VTN49DRAFT_3220 [Thermomyces lanuginosus]|uniref:uncharacterized protein n=1 Tax=Thermomyces lanuginosus TaxID=5541 RepID=UPI003742D11C